MESILSLFRDRTEPGRTRRSRAGLLVALAIMPFLAGVLGCFDLPVPIGNPETSRIDPAMNGMWLTAGTEDPWIVVLQPYDKRTWHVTWMLLKKTDADTGDGAGSPNDSTTPSVSSGEDQRDQNVVAGEGKEQVAEQLTSLDRLRRGGYEFASVSFQKGWLTRIRGVRFMVWEPLAKFSLEQGMAPGHWWVQRIASVTDSALHANPINPETGDLKKAATSREAESIIRDHLKDPELFLDEDSFPGYVRIPREDFELVRAMLAAAGVEEPE